MRYLSIFWLLSLLVIVLPRCAQAEVRYIVHNPLTFTVREPIKLELPADGKRYVFYDPQDNLTLTTQCDDLENGHCELVAQVTLTPGERRTLYVRAATGTALVKGGPTVTLVPGKEQYWISNDRFSFLVSTDVRDQFGMVACPITEVKYADSTIPTGIKQLQHFQLGGFTEKPSVTVRTGPVRAQIILEGPSALRYQEKENKPGRTRTILTIYAGKSLIDLETTFLPDQTYRLWIANAGLLTVDTAAGIWSLATPFFRTKALTTAEFGSESRRSDAVGCLWVAASGAQSGFAYLHDDFASTFAAKEGEGGALHSQLRFNVWNFNKKDNYINPHQLGVDFRRNEPSLLRMRLVLYPTVPREAAFAEKDYRQFRTNFLVQRQVKAPFAFTGPVAITAADRKEINRLLDGKDIAILAGDALSEQGMAAAKRLAAAWQVPLLTAKDISGFLNGQYRKDHCRGTVFVLLGSPAEHLVVQANNTLFGFADAYFPGPGKGRIAVVHDFLQAGRTVIYTGGGDAKGVPAAVAMLLKSFPRSRPSLPRLMTLPTELRVRPWMRWRSPYPVCLKACREEMESAHLLLYCPKALTGVSASASLAGPNGTRISGEIMHIRWSYPTFDGKGNIFPRGEQGSFLTPEPNNDALYPGFPAALAAGSQTSCWVNFAIGTDVPAGVYRGHVVIRWKGGMVKSPVELQVVDITLPEHWVMHLNMMYGQDAYTANIFQHYLDIKPEARRAYEDALAALGRLLETHGVTVANISAREVRLTTELDGGVHLDLQSLEWQIAAYRRGGFTGLFELGLPVTRWSQMATEMSKALKITFEEANARLCRRMRGWLAAQHLEGRLFIRVGDEPGDFDKWRQLASPLKDSGLLLSVCHNKTDEASMRKIAGVIDIWCPNWIFTITRYGRRRPDDDPDIFNQRFFTSRKQQGEQVWNYTCSGGAPYAALRHMPTEIRYYLWDSYAKGCDGAMYYGGAYWPHMWAGGELGGKGVVELRDKFVFDVFHNDAYPGGWPGGTTVMYPDAASHRVISSQRLELFREGQEDLKLFCLLRERIGTEKLTELLTPVIEPLPNGKAFDDLPPEALLAVREEAIRLLSPTKAPSTSISHSNGF